MPMARTHFTVGDVEALIPALERIFTDILQLRAALLTHPDLDLRPYAMAP